MQATRATFLGRPRRPGRDSAPLMTGFQRIAESVAMNRTLRTSVRPPAMAAPAAHLPGVAIDRRDTDEGGDTTAIELAEFRQIGDQRMRR